MGTKHHSVADPASDPKKQRRVGFSKIDAGVTPNECIKIYLVSTKEEVGSPDSFLIEPVDLNHFFEEDGKIYGYKGLTITIWVSSISFLAYADISFESTSDGGRGITDLKSSLQNIFAENLVEKKEDFLQTFSTECDFAKSIASGAKVLQKNASNDSSGDSRLPKEEPADMEVLQVVGMPVGHLYSRLVPLVLLLIDGSNPIDVTDPRWEIYLLVRKDQEDRHFRLLGFAAVYRFNRYPDGKRLRLGQILVIPPYQRKGYGRHLLEVLNNVAVSENVYDLTVEEPVDSLQHVRTCIDVERLLSFEPIQDALNAVVLKLKHENLSKKSQPIQFRPPTSVIEDARKALKINKKQFLQCWEILIYLGLFPIDKYMENYRIIVSNRVKADVIGKESEGAGKRIIDIPTEFDQELSFAMFKSNGDDATGIEKDENEGNLEEQLRQLVDERMKEIELVGEKISVPRS
ncbi:histone acetyltransferase type B catalytic subunit [Olea europaea subsp. europaea]|uniref:histone acetyltransferase n=1 Tax=Olea europaea subsp. europaea TaxID=158383 RepID=A0A8S0UCT5_OLEEU|nr:histone acetyltransferase type B catalytic subunit [Olea europaea subsp. europaea]